MIDCSERVQQRRDLLLLKSLNLNMTNYGLDAYNRILAGKGRPMSAVNSTIALYRMYKRFFLKKKKEEEEED